MAAALQARGVGPGDHVALLGPTTRPLVTAIQATWLAGATVVVLPLPMRLGSIEEFVDQTRARIHNADAGARAGRPRPGRLRRARARRPARSSPSTGSATAAYSSARRSTPTRLAILQFTSGSTADPKGVMLPHRTVLANLDAAAAPPSSTPTTTCSCRGCRSTTTWASSGC